MKRKYYFPLFILAAVVMVVAASLLLSSPGPVLPVSVAFCGTTNNANGNVLYCFEVTNSMAEDTHGSYALEVYYHGVWFNALPQPKGVDEVAYLAAKGIAHFAVSAPIGRAETGLLVQPNPPGEKWRTYFCYTASAYPHNAFGTLLEKLNISIGRKTGAKGHYAFSPELSFAPGNQQSGANGRQPSN